MLARCENEVILLITDMSSSRCKLYLLAS